ncbi:MAG TPA: hypothetical protein PLW86_12950 [Rhodocyclaceae bacterium]|nr:hypothetical protein [Rhodocyclaceae bacterium]
MKTSRWWVIFGWMLLGTASAAPGDPILVTAVNAGVIVAGEGGAKAPLEPFVRLREGDRLTLPAAGSVSLVFVSQGRQENWRGAGAIVVGDGESRAVAGKPELKVRAVPPEVARQMNRMPIASADGKVGMMRTRSIPPHDAVTRLEKEYQSMRSQASDGDILPEVYLLAGLFDLRQYDRVEAELQRIAGAYPNDANVPVLRQLYAKALAEARAPRTGGQ